MKKISVIIPMYFEENTVEEAYKRTKKVFDESKNRPEYIIAKKINFD